MAVEPPVQRGKRLIDIKRESGGSFQLGEPGDAIVAMMALECRLLTVTQKAVYGTNFADHIDPDRTDISLPNIISQKLLDYGAETPFICETLLTGAELFNETYLGQNFNRRRALEIAFEAARNLAAIADLRVALAHDQKNAAEKLRSTPIGRTIELPRTSGLRSRGEALIRHADLTCQATQAISGMFYQKEKPNDGWAGHITQCLSPATAINVQTAGFLKWVLHCIEEVRDFRNACEHPDEEKAVIFRDISLKPGLIATAPSIEIKHPRSPQPAVELLSLGDRLITQCGKVFEGMVALLCSENIRMFGGHASIFNCVLAEREEAQRNNGVRYAYHVSPKPGVAWPPSTDSAK